jgi:hypothetical protein
LGAALGLCDDGRLCVAEGFEHVVGEEPEPEVQATRPVDVGNERGARERVGMRDVEACALEARRVLAERREVPARRVEVTVP